MCRSHIDASALAFSTELRARCDIPQVRPGLPIRHAKPDGARAPSVPCRAQRAATCPTAPTHKAASRA
eukprot:365668-Chlamydomonas_euryale.AAC.13